MMPRSLHLLAALTLAASVAVFAQAPDAKPADAAPRQRRPMPAPTNLKVLPKDMTAQQVVAIMHKWEGDLGVECNYCHAKDDTTGRLNFASDANPIKDRARVMMKMTHAINADYLTQFTDPKPENGVSCGTCHRGMAKPSVFTPPPHERPAPPPSTPPSR
ncbi:c-type cytochrome [Granulicella sp. 5B5]|uniref:c-type cytochrome n=1 Tax=Granulicella sp. 5B5 TaxID=1617967 RepID=UPI0015F5A28A|nr:c-type cytochrome [Granulicella sp. 5B5]QMV19532.1 c-type cytochrome [Granulicella sp. 5B5]